MLDRISLVHIIHGTSKEWGSRVFPEILLLNFRSSFLDAFSSREFLSRGVVLSHFCVRSRIVSFATVCFRADTDQILFSESLILAQNERWRRGLGMQVERNF